MALLGGSQQQAWLLAGSEGAQISSGGRAAAKRSRLLLALVDYPLSSSRKITDCFNLRSLTIIIPLPLSALFLNTSNVKTVDGIFIVDRRQFERTLLVCTYNVRTENITGDDIVCLL
jgi:hypothetical protein